MFQMPRSARVIACCVCKKPHGNSSILTCMPTSASRAQDFDDEVWDTAAGCKQSCMKRSCLEGDGDVTMQGGNRGMLAKGLTLRLAVPCCLHLISDKLLCCDVPTHFKQGRLATHRPTCHVLMHRSSQQKACSADTLLWQLMLLHSAVSSVMVSSVPEDLWRARIQLP